MPKFGSVVIPDAVLDALRDDRLVVFAGAGVSVGAPAKLPNFECLAIEIGKKVSIRYVKEKESADQFLGRLHSKGVPVHKLAAERLNNTKSVPNQLHYDLLKLFGSADKVRIITTNFDRHFGVAADELKQQKHFKTIPMIYQAPAMPVGDCFNGIVHVHGVLGDIDKMVLTDRDFGRAYLAEGWALRFLYEMFKKYVVLFVGYSHSDVVMKYLARALPESSGEKRYAIIPDGNKDEWSSLGIRTTTYQKSQDHQELCNAVSILVNAFSRSAGDWRDLLKEICKREPMQINETNARDLNLALKKSETTHFFTELAKHPDWPKWLAEHEHLSSLFKPDGLLLREKMLAHWLVDNYAIKHPNTLFFLATKNKFCLNPLLWKLIFDRLGQGNANNSTSFVFEKWAMAYLSFAKASHNPEILQHLAKQCSEQKLAKLTVKVFLRLGEYSFEFNYNTQEKSFFAVWSSFAGYESMNQIWLGCLKPQLAFVAQDLVEGIYSEISKLHSLVTPWKEKVWARDLPGQGRLAIEKHEENRIHEAFDVMLDAMRDALEWLLKEQTAKADEWIERMKSSNVVFFRRLAIHAIGVHPQKTADERLEWLLKHTFLIGYAEHHEIFQAAAKSYPHAKPAARKALIDAVLECEVPLSARMPTTNPELTKACGHYDWLTWLLKTDAECPLLLAQLSKLTTKYPGLKPRSTPDFLMWDVKTLWQSEMPGGAKKLLNNPPSVQMVDELMKFKQDYLERKGSYFGLTTLYEACEQNPTWGIDLAKFLSTHCLQKVDLWEEVLSGFVDADLKEDDCMRLLKLIAESELHVKHAFGIATLLMKILNEHSDKPSALDLLKEINEVALDIWRSELGFDKQTGNKVWNDQAIYEQTEAALELKLFDGINEAELNVLQRKTGFNVQTIGLGGRKRVITEPSELVIEIWMLGLTLLHRDKPIDQAEIPDRYRQWFDMALGDKTVKGSVARYIFASYVGKLFIMDEDWTRKRIIPLFAAADRLHFLSAWLGFLSTRQYSQNCADELKPGILEALGRLNEFEDDVRQSFFAFFAQFVVHNLDNPSEVFIHVMLRYANENDRNLFFLYVHLIYHHLPSSQRRKIWNSWLSGYWKDRWDSRASYTLTPEEAASMLQCLPWLQNEFPEAASRIVCSKIAIGDFNLAFPLLNSGLVDRFPETTARLLMYLCRQDIHGNRSSVVIELCTFCSMLRPRSKQISERLKCKLNEQLRKNGIGPTLLVLNRNH